MMTNVEADVGDRACAVCLEDAPLSSAAQQPTSAIEVNLGGLKDCMQHGLFQIKICGIIVPEDAELAVQAGADAIGLNFCQASKRRVELDVAREITTNIKNRAASVGIFVNSSVQEICRIADLVDLDYVQLHGDESPETCAVLHERKVIKAFRFQASRVSEITRFLDACPADRLPKGLLIDAYHPDSYGGTGTQVDWRSLAKMTSDFVRLPLVLAGGLSDSNVAEAISLVRPTAVDTASGVESAPGQKDPTRVRSFVTAAKQAFAELAAVD